MSSQRKQKRENKLHAFETIVSEYEGPLLRYITRIVRNADTAQDIAQNTFIRFFKNWNDELAPCPQVSAWLYRVAHNCAIDYIRKETRRDMLHTNAGNEQPTSTPPNRGESFRISEEAEKAANALKTLSDREQQLVVLKVYEEKSYREISEITGLTVGNVGYILHHAMKKMAVQLKGSNSNETGQ